jgi:hypothetical protein
MFDSNEQVQAYETDCVNLPQAVKDKLRDQREANRTRLKRNRPDSIRCHGSNQNQPPKIESKPASLR